MKRIVFHCPFPVKEAALHSANLARPVKMLAAFKREGYQVIGITGNARQRRRGIARLKSLVGRGVAIEFAYSETSNLPLFFNEDNRLPSHPLLEYRFFLWLRRRGIPIGLFLRDLHWRFPHFRQYSLYKRLPALLFYWLDWLLYMSRCDQLFVPSAGLADCLPTRMSRAGIKVLPPGCDDRESMPPAKTAKHRSSLQGLFLLYVGGVTPPLYNLKPIFDCAKRLPLERVVICCRQDEWQKAMASYAEEPQNNVRFVHAQGADLAAYYREADLFIFTLESYEYMDLAMPYKIFEAVSHRLPIVAFAGTEAARWIADEDAGWVVRDLEELLSLIGRLREAPELLAGKARKLDALAAKHSWTNRARAVAAALGAAGAAQ
jgi:glycosyltransferase involved in cell wall biosynthesis